jgi:chemosensory pili system protein ChpC
VSEMNGTAPALENILPKDVPCLLLPFAQCTWLVPTVTVAEIVGYSIPSAIENSPNWLLGEFTWRDQSVPMLSFERLNGDAQPELSIHTRVAVLNHTGLSDEVPFLAVATAGIPKLARVTSQDISLLDQELSNALEKAHVSLNGDNLIIPEIAALERTYIEWANAQ